MFIYCQELQVNYSVSLLVKVISLKDYTISVFALQKAAKSDDDVLTEVKFTLKFTVKLTLRFMMLNQIYVLAQIITTEGDEGVILTPVNSTIENVLHGIATFLQHICEIIALLIIAIAIVTTLQRVFLNLPKLKNHRTQAAIRLEFGEALAMSLTYLLAADIVATAIAPTWDSLGKLALIAVIRTALNYFLAREVRELEEKSHNHQQTASAELG